MYYVSCDGFPLLDWRDKELILENPKVNLQVNTVCEGSFTIYKNHPNYDKLHKLKSVFEVSDETGVIFRGRATGDTIDFNHGKAVDLEGAMAYFNDTIVRPFMFPEDFLTNSGYVTASKSGNVVAFFLGWLIEQHNSKVQDFQRFKLGNVTVADPNNYIIRSNSDYSSTWETLKSKLFDSALGGYLCIRYEEDGNYIDYLSEFEETNTQEIVFGENMLDLTNETTASGTYSALIPIGADGLTVSKLSDVDITDDIVKSGDTIYSRSAVEAYGWVCAPTSETKWDDVTDAKNLLTKGVEWLTGSGLKMANTIEATAVDLHFTDAQIRSLRIYKNVKVYSEPHDLSDIYPLSKLEIDLLNPQNTKIMVGKTTVTLTDKTSSSINKVVQTVFDSLELEDLDHEDIFNLLTKNGELQGLFRGEDGDIYFNASYIKTGTMLANLIKAGILQSKDGETFRLDLDKGTFKMRGSGRFQSTDGQTFIEIEGDEIVLYAWDEATDTYLDKIHIGFIHGASPDGTSETDYPYMVFGKDTSDSVGLIKKFWNGFWLGNSVPMNDTGNFEGKEGAAGFFVDTQKRKAYVVAGTDMQNVYTGEAIARFK